MSLLLILVILISSLWSRPTTCILIHDTTIVVLMYFKWVGGGWDVVMQVFTDIKVYFVHAVQQYRILMMKKWCEIILINEQLDELMTQKCQLGIMFLIAKTLLFQPLDCLYKMLIT